ncbi:hypothetical protein EVAR_33378_1 [Eumeta japonica]|uniref:Uncharacterized protein n=1 Tax=Eumeta variegata TaxID=151549 RepID=A0A4C1X4G4_EUMVA|nr:hypothetical protein EVAR_33378_1 [Eumeta japonica]
MEVTIYISGSHCCLQKRMLREVLNPRSFGTPIRLQRRPRRRQSLESHEIRVKRTSRERRERPLKSFRHVFKEERAPRAPPSTHRRTSRSLMRNFYLTLALLKL